MALLAVPLLVLAYRLGLADRRSKVAVALHPDLALLTRAGEAGRPWTRHLGAGLYLAAVAVALFGVARPAAPIPVPDRKGGVMLALETSFTMYANDIVPTRMEAMKAAARSVVKALPEGVKVGLATFSGSATLNVPLTLDRDRVLEAIDGLEMSGGVAFGLGLAEALTAFPPGKAQGTESVVLVAHGHDFSGHDPMVPAEDAASRGIVVHAIGVGTHGYNFSDQPLKKVADMTGGRYYDVRSADTLRDAHRQLQRVLGWRLAPSEVTALVALAAALLLGASLAAGQRQRRIA